MSSLKQRSRGLEYWRSLDELADTPEFRAYVKHEFPHLVESLESAPSRRTVLKLMGASLALAGLTGCRWPKETIVEYARRPGGRTPGVPQQFATVMELDGVSQGLLVTSYDGRPIKVEGNPLHPSSFGGSSTFAQAAILELYDPDRSTRPVLRGAAQGTTSGVPANAWADCIEAMRKLGDAARAAGGAGLCILAEPSSSLTLADAKAALLKALPQAGWYEYSPLSRDTQRKGTAMALGRAARPNWKLDEARVIASFDEDFLLTHPSSVRFTRDYSRRRANLAEGMNRLFVIESTLSLTGSNADYRFVERSASIPAVLAHLAAALAKSGIEIPGFSAAAAEGLGTAPHYVGEMAKDLAANLGQSVVMVGPRQPAEAHALACAINQGLGNAGRTVVYVTEPDGERPGGVESITALCERLKGGTVETLVILGGNPVFNAPADLAFANCLTKAKVAVHLSLFNDETSRECTWHVPQAHFLEAWGDSRAWDGTISVAQPLIDPIFGGKSAVEVVSLLAGEAMSGHDLVRRAIGERLPAGADPEKLWRSALHDGVLVDTFGEEIAAKVGVSDWSAALGQFASAAKAGDGFELVFAADHRVHDGRFANNAWLQELPDPLTKLTWDNAALMSPADAAERGLKRDDKVEISLDGRTISIPVCPLPGHAKGSLTLPLGYGRTAGGAVADGSGFNVYALRSAAAANIARGAKVTATGGRYALATTQDHHAMATKVGDVEVQRRVPELVREASLDHYKEHPDFARHVTHALPLLQLFASHDNPDAPKWAMSVDLNKCTGCSACVVACQAENNIPVVGKEEVQLGREMHWMRIDRYFRGDPQSPDVKVVHQPLTCHQCENAPCEQVCPVAATVHDEQGLNVMVYNRCIGTRYCSNNCPYKVRRFNWFFNHHGPKHPRSRKTGTIEPLNPFKPALLPQQYLTEIEMMGNNPAVTVRSRGVMEKCTFCVQRIAQAKIDARNNQLSPGVNTRTDGLIPDGTVVTACMQACPAEAIGFGDLRQADAKVTRQFDDKRSYFVLEEVGVRPRLKYLAKIRNAADPHGHGGGHGHEGPGHKSPGHGGGAAKEHS